MAKKFDFTKLYRPIGLLFLSFLVFYLTFFLYAWIDSIWPFRFCPGYWAFCVLVQFMIMTLIPLVAFTVLGCFYLRRPRFRQTRDVNKIATSANRLAIFKYLGIALGYFVLFFFFICLLILVVLVGVYHNVTVPQQSRDVFGLGGVQSRNGINLERDSNNMVHVTASNAPDVAYGLAFAHCQDRFYQMDLYRRIAMGWLSEIDGSDRSIQSDIFMRTLGLNQSAIDDYPLLSSDAQAWLSAYARGVNDYMSVRPNTPWEFYMNRYTNSAYRAWTPEHSLAILKLVQFTWSGNFNMELLRGYFSLNRGLSGARISELLPPFPINGYSTFSASDLDVPRILIPQNAAAEANRIANEAARVDALQAKMGVTGPPTTASKYTSLEVLTSFWDATVNTVRDLASVISLSTSTSTFILQGGTRVAPMMGNSMTDGWSLSAPNFYYPAQIKYALTVDSDSSQAVGSTIPGIPGMFSGRAPSYAWSVSPMNADVMDWFVMKDNADGSGYLGSDGNFRSNYTIRSEVINVNGRSPITIKVRTSEFGPVLTDAFKLPFTNAAGVSMNMSLQWTGNYNSKTTPDRTIEFLSQSWTARTTDTLGISQSFSSMASRLIHVPALNVFYVDRIDGTAVYIGAGRIPSRVQDHSGMFPVLGDGSIQWNGFSTNPVSSVRLIQKTIISSAGNRPIGPGYPYNWGYDFADQFRSRRLFTNFNTQLSERASTTAMGQAALIDRYPAILDDFQPLISQLVSATDLQIDGGSLNNLKNLQTWDGSEGGLTTLLETFYWELSRLTETETGVAFWNRPEFILNAMLPNRTNLINVNDTTGYISQAQTLRNDQLCINALNNIYPSVTTTNLGRRACLNFAAQAFMKANGRVGGGTNWGSVKSASIPHYGFSGTVLECTSSRSTSRTGSQFTVTQGSENPPSGQGFGSYSAQSGPLYRQFIDYQPSTGGSGVYQFLTPMGTSGNQWTKTFYDNFQSAYETDTGIPMQISGEYGTVMYQYLRPTNI
ncbi:quiP [Acrasis kona]|uniref:QuiP n=1 Tax=Acrasis kona TaxID=1008807 RepID=A0AAW2YIU4_9EUKA